MPAAWRKALWLKSWRDRRALLPWLLILLGFLWKLAEVTHTLKFILEALGGSRFGPLWLVLIGIVWLAGVVLWAATRPSEGDKVRKLEKLRRRADYVIRKFEALSCAYEKSLVQAYSDGVSKARAELMHATSEMLQAALETLPEDQRHEYIDTLLRVYYEYTRYHDSPSSLFAPETPSTNAILGGIEKFLPPASASSPSPPSPAPPSSTVS